MQLRLTMSGDIIHTINRGHDFLRAVFAFGMATMPRLIRHVSVKSIFQPNISATTGFVCHINVTGDVEHENIRLIEVGAVVLCCDL